VSRAPLDVPALSAGLESPWVRLSVVDETASTNTDLLGVAASTPEGTVLVAEHQTAGRGRLDRVWTSPPRSGLTFSVLVRPGTPRTTWGWLPLLSGVAVCDAVGAAGLPAMLKWPNDVLLGAEQRKGAGILVQVAGEAAVIGIGLNVSTTADELPVPTAASLATEGGEVERSTLLATILTELGYQYVRWRDARGNAEVCGLAADYLERCATLGLSVTVTTAGGATLRGLATGIDAEGRLRVTAEGRDHVVAAGDVEHIRAGAHER
jgi:BirA family transcriptional regulator, biotin operon repressor / biotin---[acetyl-CoA-carboxylase] ligase